MSEPLHTEKGASTRNKILAEARRLLVERGYEGLVMRDVADRCGVRLGNLQYYFKTRDGLVLAIIAAESEKDRAAIAQAMDKHTAPEEALRAIVTELIGRWRGDSGPVYAVMNLMALHSDPFRSLFKQVYADHYRTLEAAIACLTPDLSNAEIKLRVRLLTALIDGAALQTDVGRLPTFMAHVADQACAIALGRERQ